MKSREPPDSGYWDLSGDALAYIGVVLGSIEIYCEINTGYNGIYICIGYYSMKVQRPHGLSC